MARFSRFLFAVAAGFLILLAASLMGFAAYQVGAAFVTLPKVLASGDFGYTIIDSIGYVVIAIAIIDVAKHLIEEEVMGRHDAASGFRENFPKFISIISIAIFLEGLVLVFKTTQDDIKLVVYPVLLLLVGVAMTVGLAIFQRFGAASSRGEATSRRATE